MGDERTSGRRPSPSIPQARDRRVAQDTSPSDVATLSKIEDVRTAEPFYRPASHHELQNCFGFLSRPNIPFEAEHSGEAFGAGLVIGEAGTPHVRSKQTFDPALG
jgi:hypothetical protein